MELSVLNIQGKETGKKVTLSDEIFGIEPNEHVVWLDVKQFLANKRQGTHKAKERAEVSRSTRKLKRQKGTGGARAGSMKSPLFKGGGRVFGPVPRIEQESKIFSSSVGICCKSKSRRGFCFGRFLIRGTKNKSILVNLERIVIGRYKNIVDFVRRKPKHLFVRSQFAKNKSCICWPSKYL